MAGINDSGDSSLGSGAADFAQRLKRDGRERLESGKQSAADQIERLAGAVDAAACHLQSDQPSAAAYAGRLASGIGSVANRLRDGSLEDLMTQTRQFAARQPAAFVAGGFLIGLALARFAKVSARQESDADSDYPQDAGSVDEMDEPVVVSSSDLSDETDYEHYRTAGSNGRPGTNPYPSSEN